ncbi:soluble inorganic pyrophosphatase [Trifolium repens]|nr:soluble inorganic pyrophosphatase [Trifolium repens]
MASNNNISNEETSKGKKSVELPSVVALNERILSSMADKKDAAAHPWHNLEIDLELHQFSVVKNASHLVCQVSFLLSEEFHVRPICAYKNDIDLIGKIEGLIEKNLERLNVKKLSCFL